MNADGRADPEGFLDALADAGVIDDGPDLTLTADFQGELEVLEACFRELDREELRSTVEGATGSAAEADALLDVAGEHPSILAEYVALSRETPLAHGERLRALAVFDSFRDPPPDAGAPDAFLPVSGERLPLLVSLHHRAVVYVWRHDCPPCDLMREDLDDLLDAPPEDLALFAVYGPECAARLHELYDVPGGPATLFFLDGKVDARLYGAHHREVVETEIEKHRTLG